MIFIVIFRSEVGKMFCWDYCWMLVMVKNNNVYLLGMGGGIDFVVVLMDYLSVVIFIGFYIILLKES